MLRIKGHKLTNTSSKERCREARWVGSCPCGWSEAAHNHKVIRSEYRYHLNHILHGDVAETKEDRKERIKNLYDRTKRLRNTQVLEKLNKIAQSRGGRCLSEVYVNCTTKLTWQCGMGHKWEATPNLINSGSWCPECPGPEKIQILNKLREIAKSRGGRCLSGVYINSRTKLDWQCARGHQWETTSEQIDRGHWCPKCYGFGKTIEDIKIIAAKYGGICLSSIYKNMVTKLRWQCKSGHIWDDTLNTIVKGRWCPKCRNRSYTLKDYQEIAQERGGKLISAHYAKSLDKYLWECNVGHRWEQRAVDVKRGSWCPSCKTSRGQQLCRAIFEHIFGKSFPTVRPVWLRTDKRTGMELDGYNEELQIAFEDQGFQHYEFNNKYTKTEKNLHELKQRDVLKKQRCEINRVKLIIVEDVQHRFKVDSVEKFLIHIVDLIKAQNIEIPPFEPFTDFTKIWENRSLSDMKQLAKTQQGALLDEIYMGSTFKLKWKCKNGHIFLKTPRMVKVSIRKGTNWCHECAVPARYRTKVV